MLPKAPNQTDEERFESHIFFRFFRLQISLRPMQKGPLLQGYVTSVLTLLIINVGIDSL